MLLIEPEKKRNNPTVYAGEIVENLQICRYINRHIHYYGKNLVFLVSGIFSGNSNKK